MPPVARAHYPFILRILLIPANSSVPASSMIASAMMPGAVAPVSGVSISGAGVGGSAGTTPSFATPTVAGSVETPPHTFSSPAVCRSLLVRMPYEPSVLRSTSTMFVRLARNASGRGRHADSGSSSL